MLFTQGLRQLFLQSVDAFFRFAYLALRFFPQLFGALAELHALQFGNQGFQPVDFAGVRRHPFREQAIVLRHLAKRVLLLQQLRPESGVFIGIGSDHLPTLQQVISAGQAVPFVADVSS